MCTPIELTRREREVLNTNLTAEIMKMQYHYADRVARGDIPERLDVLYSLRTKLCVGRDPIVQHKSTP